MGKSLILKYLFRISLWILELLSFQSKRMNLVFLATINDPFVAVPLTSLWFDRMNHGNSTLLKSDVPEDASVYSHIVGSHKPLCILGMKLPQLTWLCCQLVCMLAKWKQFTLGKNAIYETIKYNYVCKPFTSSSPWHLEEPHSHWGTECSRNPKLECPSPPLK